MKSILDALEQLKNDQGITVLFACETGSRAWGFPSPDSDYDVRFLYRHERDWYLSLAKRKDTVEAMIGELDITGWDLRKSLNLLKKSNVPLIERFQSPMIYSAAPGFQSAFRELINACYSPLPVFHHHYSMARKLWAEVREQESVKLKTCFYLIRSLLSCNWILNDESVLPMHLEGLMKYVDDERKEALRSLVQLKAGKEEKYLHALEGDMHAWIEGLMELAAANKNKPRANSRTYAGLDAFFLKELYEKADN